MPLAVSNVLSSDILRPLNRVNRGTERYHILYNIFDSCQANILVELQEAILNIVDEEATSTRKDAVVIRRGFSPELDEWKDQYECLEGKTLKEETFENCCFLLSSCITNNKKINLSWTQTHWNR